MKIFIDYTNGALGSKSAKFHGGGSFTRWLTAEIILLKQSYKELKLCLLISQKNFEFTPEEEKLINTNEIDCVLADNILEYSYPKDSILILPLIPSYKLNIVKKLKSINNLLKVYTVIHGVRNLDMVKYDSYDKYYNYSIPYFKSPIIQIVKYLKFVVEWYSIKRYIRYSDKIFTVSNYTLQKLIEIKDVKYITYFHQQSQLDFSNVDESIGDNYTFFVNCSRAEKNFARTLVAFCKYKLKSNNDLYLYATGANDVFINSLKKIKAIDWQIVEKWVRFLDYVPSGEFASLYKNCKYLTYTSKSEGYGIPVLEATIAGRPVLASYKTSIPEVIGSSAIYVDPYSVDSIVNGFIRMENVEYTEEFSLKLSNLLILRQTIDESIIKSFIS